MSQMKYNPAVASKRRERDIMKLLMTDYKVVQSKENSGDFVIEFPGPKDTLYQGGLWQVHVLLPEQYPFKSPSIGFNNKMYHPNVDEGSGSVCLDVINQAWSPMYDLVNVFDTFLPQLLSYPNPTDPLNPEAAALLIKDETRYEKKVKEFVLKYATTQQQKIQQQQKNNSNNNNKSINSNIIAHTNNFSSTSTDNSGGSMPESFGSQDGSEKGSLNYRKISDQTFSDSNKQETEEEDEMIQEEDKISNISMDNVSELSDLSNLDDLNECY